MQQLEISEVSEWTNENWFDQTFKKETGRCKMFPHEQTTIQMSNTVFPVCVHACYIYKEKHT